MRARIIPALLLALLLAACTSTTAQNLPAEKVPQTVRTAFSARFAAAQKVQWELEKEHVYEAEFTADGAKASACFDATGKWLETETDVQEAALPEAVRKTIAAKYAHQKVEECEEVETPDGKHYEVEVKKDGKATEVELKADGTVVSSKLEEEDKDEKD